MKRVYNIILAILMVFMIGVGANAQQKFVVIANNDVPVDQVNKSLLKRIYNGFMTQWNGGGKIKPCYTEVGGGEFWLYIGTSQVNFNKFWTKRVFSGNGVSPIEHKTDAEVIKYVNNISGAIGVISVSGKSKIGDSSKELSLSN
ncbi:MAG: hypothetical protein JXR07_04775 [Reichenbachiella sp.]